MTRLNREILVQLGLKDNQSSKFEMYKEILRRADEIQGEAWGYISAMIQSLENGYLRLDDARYQCRPAKFMGLVEGGSANIPLEQHLENLKTIVRPFKNSSPTEWGKVAERIIKKTPTLFGGVTTHGS
jgi:hypothetical protein